MKEKFQLFLAILVAALWSDLFKASTWYRLRVLVSLWFWTEEEHKVDRKDYLRRMTACRACPLFYKPLQTCSSPLKKDAADLGCWCHMTSKASLEHATCWLDDNVQDSEYGWHENAD